MGGRDGLAAANARQHQGIQLVGLARGQQLAVDVCGLGGDQRALLLQLERCAQPSVQIHIRGAHLGGAQPGQGLLERGQHLVLGLGEQQATWHRHAQARHRAWHQGRPGLLGQHGVRLGAVQHAARQRAHRIQGERQRERPLAWHPGLRGLEPGHPVQGCGNADGTAGVRTDGDLAHPPRHGHAGPGRRAPRNARCIPGIARRAVMRIDADARERELGHVGLADDDRARSTQALHDHGIALGRRCRLPHLGARRRGLSRHIKQVLDGHDAPIQRSQADAGGRAGIGRRGGLQGRVGIHLGEDARTFGAGIGNRLQSGAGAFERGRGHGGFIRRLRAKLELRNGGAASAAARGRAIPSRNSERGGYPRWPVRYRRS